MNKLIFGIFEYSFERPELVISVYDAAGRGHHSRSIIQGVRPALLCTLQPGLQVSKGLMSRQVE